MKRSSVIVALTAALAFVGPFAQAAEKKKFCNETSCEAGDKLITYATKSDFYIACPTMELSEYANLVIGLIAFNAQMIGKMPDISPVTGEPAYQGETAAMLQRARTKARVSSFDQAMSVCRKGVGKKVVTVMNGAKESDSIWVVGQDNKPFWMPKSHLKKM
ncbi:hypothetical protein VL04_17470 [Chromobacterium violaceum]|uniref:hypothetical protein n=1 Tax=Chromobacterium violaceum TaxID=536 RepID=UPI000653A3E0|nr:hypothetical protein [Chromobacterium violaceum]KMN48758.1 hypothetical protein VK93_14735 [Chromobacterium violaceum]KMN87853.1 hypothetical protein VL02_00730 [Chromobacterium violaceum]KMN89082.1 hypothetical protein VL04_17470 [Chromobacterium violaceum]KMO05456.1 hypothetical protein VL16_02715 [Chromobacterium violaceum]